jgi:hypothetical protein
VLGIEVERRIHRPHPAFARAFPVQHVREMAADAVVVGLDINPPAMQREVVPVEQHRPQRGDEPVGDVARPIGLVPRGFRQHAGQHGDARPHHVHGVRCGGNGLQDGPHRRRNAAQHVQLRLVAAQLGLGRQGAVDEQMRYLLEAAAWRDVENVVAAVMQVVARAADRAEPRIAGDDAG